MPALWLYLHNEEAALTGKHGAKCNCEICRDRRALWAQIQERWPELATLLKEIAEISEPVEDLKVEFDLDQDDKTL